MLCLIDLTYFFRPVRGMAHSFQGRKLPDMGVDGSPGIEEPGDREEDGTVVLCNYNNLLIKWWDPGHADAGNGLAAAVAWEQE